MSAAERDWVPKFAFDIVDAVELGFGYVRTPDSVDVLNAGREIAVRCLQCRQEWLMGPEALASGKCWRCRNAGPC